MEFSKYVKFYDDDRANRRKYRKQGIYGFFLCGEVVYVGQSHDLHSRFVKHAENFARVRFKDIESNNKYKFMRPFIEQVEWRVLEYTNDLNAAEAKWINHYRPIFNIIMPDGSRQHFKGIKEDIAAFVRGEKSINDLRKLVKVSDKDDWD